MKNRFADKLRSCSGFSFAEMLAAMVILLLVSGIVARGIPVASDVYMKVVDSANAETLLSTTMTCLRDEFDLAHDIEINGSEITYTSALGRMYNLKNTDQGIHVADITNEDEEGLYDRLLVSASARTSKLHAAYDSVSVSEGIVTFTNLSVFREGTEITGIPEFRIRVINDEEKTD